jgi:hypothetical protein
MRHRTRRRSSEKKNSRADSAVDLSAGSSDSSGGSIEIVSTCVDDGNIPLARSTI